MNIIKLCKKFNKMKQVLIPSYIAYAMGIFTENFKSAETFDEMFDIFSNFNFSKPSVCFLAIGFVLVTIIWIISITLERAIKNQDPSVKFAKIMKEKTADVIKDVDSDYSWGYNMCLNYSKDPRGWLPQEFVITDYEKQEYTFPNKEIMNGYSNEFFEKYRQENKKIKSIVDKNENRNRFAIAHLKQNTNKKNIIFDIKLRKTKWIPLQFHWDYFRTYDFAKDTAIDNPNTNIIKEHFKKLFMCQGVGNDGDILINSFCLHLIITTKNGVILARIGRSKENDYPGTWAATIGEQINESDFYIGDSSAEGDKFKNNFVQNWVKRALKEELGVDDTAYEDFFLVDSLKVLSIDFEADIYNIALTSIIEIKGDFDTWKQNRNKHLDRMENYELREFDENDVKEILLNYPNNVKEYHPSTYLRLLMFLRHKLGTHKLSEFLLKKR